MLDKSVT